MPKIPSTRISSPARPRMTGLAALAAGALLAWAPAALAQGAAAPGAAQAPNMPPPAATVPEKVAPTLDPAPDTTGTLSDKLNKTDGVIKPPANIDPEIHKPAPEGNTGRMPVIPPPGSPGSSSTVDPK